MELNFFKDKLFELLNECESMNIADIETNDAVGAFTIKTVDGDLFIIECRKIHLEGNKNKQTCFAEEEQKVQNCMMKHVY